MTKEEAIKYLQQLYPNGGHCWLDEQRIEAIGMAVKALQEEPVLSYVERIGKNWKEEPVSEGLEAELDKYIQDNFTIDKEQLDRFGIEEKDYMYSMDKSDMEKMVRYFTGNHKIPVSDDLEEAAKLYVSDSLCITSEEDWDDAAIEALNAYKAGAQWQKEKEYTCYEEAFEDGAKWKGEHLWKPADGDDLPEIDREVIVLIKYNAQRNIHDEEYPTYRVGFGHRPNPNGWDGKNIDTNEVTHYIPKLYDKGGWNAPNIVYWLDARLPYEENKIIK